MSFRMIFENDLEYFENGNDAEMFWKKLAVISYQQESRVRAY